MELSITRALYIATLFACCITPILAAPSVPIQPQQILYTLHANDLNESLSLYHQYALQLGHHDHDLIQQIALQLLDQGSRNSDPEIQIMTLFGAGLAMHEKVQHILEKGLKNSIPQLQLVALNFIGKCQDDLSRRFLIKAMASNYLLIRLEALYQLSQRKDAIAVGQAEALMSKAPSPLWPLFPQFFALIGNADAMKILRKLLNHPDEQVRIAAMLSAERYKRDDLLPKIRILAAQHSPAQAEASAYVLGSFKDEESRCKLEQIAQKGSLYARLAALRALYLLGNNERQTDIESIAMLGEPFAIALLGDIPGSEEALYSLTSHPAAVVRLNAAIALLRLKDRRSVQPIIEFLIRDTRHLTLEPIASPGGSLQAYRVASNIDQRTEVGLGEISLRLREQILMDASSLPEELFLYIASQVFESLQNDLVPETVHCLEKIGTSNAIQLLKKYQQMAGAPLIRNYCNLALYRLKEGDVHRTNLITWVKEQHQSALIQFREMPSDFQGKMFQLTPEEKSRLLVEAFETFASNRDGEGIDILLDAIHRGNVKNRYALAGLLIRAAN